jgi:protein-disulfide isomerase
MNKNKNSYFLFAMAGLFLVAAIFISACGNSGGSGNGAANGSTTNRANRNANAANNSQSQSAIPAGAPAGASPAHYKGGAAALVTIEEFADFQCPTCAVLHPTVQQIHAAYGDRVKIIFRNFPLQQIHPKAYDAAVAAEAAGLQGKFWEMQNELFRNQQLWANASDHRKLFEDYAQKIGLDANKFRDDVAGMAAKARVDADMARARAINVGSTPSFYVNGRLLTPDEMEFGKFRAVIDAEMQKAMAARQQQQQAAPPQTSAPQTTTQTATAPISANPSGANTSSASDGSGAANKTTGANK